MRRFFFYNHLLSFLFIWILSLLIRLSFFIIHNDSFIYYSRKATLISFISGAQTDLLLLCILNTPVFILVALCFSFKWLNNRQYLIKGVFLIINISFLIFNIIDIAVFDFLGEKLSFDMVEALKLDIIDQFVNFFLYFWKYTFSLLIFSSFLAYVLPFRFFKNKFGFSGKNRISLTLTSLFSVFIISSVSYYKLKGAIINEDSFTLSNPTYSFWKARKELSKKNFFNNELEAITTLHTKIEDYFSYVKSIKKDRINSKLNVIILVVESMNIEFLKSFNGSKSYMPFIDSFSKNTNSLFF